jgi:hypothetical protein
VLLSAWGPTDGVDVISVSVAARCQSFVFYACSHLNEVLSRWNGSREQITVPFLCNVAPRQAPLRGDLYCCHVFFVVWASSSTF